MFVNKKNAGVQDFKQERWETFELGDIPNLYDL